MSKKRSNERYSEEAQKTPKHSVESGPRQCAVPSRLHLSKSINMEKSEIKGWRTKQSLDALVGGEPEIERLRGIVIEVEGNIGSGKSTLTGMLKNWIDSKVGAEVGSCFGEKVNSAFLKAFYSNPKRFSFAFQMYMLTTRLYQMDESYRQARSDQKLCFLDRGAVGDSLFALLNFQLGSIDQQEMDIYRSVCHERLPASISDQVDLIVYLDVDPSECFRRMTMLRKRESESTVPLSYLDAVDSCYFHLLMDWVGERKGTFHEMNIGATPPTIILRWDKFGNVDEVARKILSLRSGKRSTISVQFRVEKPSAFLTLDTSEEITSLFQTLSETGHLVGPAIPLGFVSSPDIEMEGREKQRSPSPPSPPSSPASEAEDAGSPDSPPTKSEKKAVQAKVPLAVNWDLEHNNAFKRVVMYYLSEGIPVVFYGQSTIVKSASVSG